MDDLTKEWHDMARKDILERRRHTRMGRGHVVPRFHGGDLASGGGDGSNLHVDGVDNGDDIVGTWMQFFWHVG